MATKAKPWPRNVEYARLDAIAKAMQISEKAEELIEDHLSVVEVIRLGAQVKGLALEIQMLLNAVRDVEPE